MLRRGELIMLKTRVTMKQPTNAFQVPSPRLHSLLNLHPSLALWDHQFG